MKRTILGLGVCIYLIASVPEAADPPARVARLSFIEGSVSFRPAAVEDWVAATLNYPLSTGDRLWTDKDAFAELHIGQTAIHLAPQAAFALSYLDDTVLQVSLSQGSADVWLPVINAGEMVEVDTPNGAVTLVEAGAYRVDVDVENNATSVTVRTGEADVIANGRTVKVRPGRMLQLVANQELADTQQAPAPDAWEESCTARDQAAEQAVSDADNYVPPDMEGAEDLAQNGDWSTDPTYGPVWRPVNLPADWAPYRNGHWSYIPPWGWTWIDQAKWGFAPFHYGRWALVSGSWVWAPGRRTEHPVYAPALVVFLSGNRLNAMRSDKGLVAGWIPLAPREIYRPPYTASENYVHRLNAAAGADGTGVVGRIRDLPES